MNGVGKRTLTLDSSWSNELENVDPKHVADHLSVVSVGAPGVSARADHFSVVSVALLACIPHWRG